ncbi:MAG: SpoIVB peptidase, partial [Clostridiales bacterium]
AIYPAKDSGFETGDFIIKINDISVNNNQQVAEIIDKAGKMDMKLNVKYIRNGEAKTTEIKALYCEDTKSYRTGLYIRDNTAGVGTLTFYDPVSGKYGALGHMISDLQDKSTNKALGSIVRANIQGIKIGRKGVPGEKMGVFVGGSWQGSIEKNTNFGIFGSLDKEMKSDFYPQALPIALIDQVKEGPAKILTVINGEKIEEYDINIMKILPNHKASGKGMVIEVTDERLLSQTGGIVQGMSGSPIIQNGRLIGAVSHVFINDPMKGYGCFAFWMMEEMQ